MKKTLIAFLMALLALSAAQDNTVTDAKRGFVLRFREFLFRQLPGGIYRFNLKSPGSKVYVASKQQGIELYAPVIDVDALALKSREVNTVKTATATGGIRAIRTALDGRSDITGKTGKYAMARDGGTLKVAGPVRIINFSRKDQRTLDATGSSLVVNLNGEGAMNDATLEGPVSIKVRQPARGGREAGYMTVTGQRMVLAQTTKSGTVTITGNVRMNGVSGGFTFDNVFKRLVLVLDSNYEITNISGDAK